MVYFFTQHELPGWQQGLFLSQQSALVVLLFANATAPAINTIAAMLNMILFILI